MSQYTWMWFFEKFGVKFAFQRRRICLPSCSALRIVIEQPSTGHAFCADAFAAVVVGPFALAPSSSPPHALTAREITARPIKPHVNLRAPIPAGTLPALLLAAEARSHARPSALSAPRNHASRLPTR